MSILIKGMKMPREGMSVVIDLWNNGKAYVYGTGNAEMYEAVELPDHGDLVDKDEAAHEIWLIRCEECGAAEWACESCDNKTAMKMVMDAPVIIPAEKE